MQLTAAQLAATIDAEVDGDPDVVITAPGKIEDAGPGTITFLGNEAYEPYLYQTGASVVIVARDFVPRQPVSPTLLRVNDVRQTVGQLLTMFQKQAQERAPRTVAEQAVIDPSASLGGRVGVGPLTVIGAGTTIGEGTIVREQVTIGRDVTIGSNCVIFPGVRILDGCVIGNECIIQANAVIGGDGFGYAPDAATGRYLKLAHIGNVVLGDRVEIGSGTTIDRATLGSTHIADGVKLDNLIQIAHNVVIGENTVVAAQTGMAGSAKVGANCRIGGQVGVGGHCRIADGTEIQAQTGIIGSITEENARIGGSPHMHFPSYMRSYVLFKQLPEVVRTLRKRLSALENRD